MGTGGAAEHLDWRRWAACFTGFLPAALLVLCLQAVASDVEASWLAVFFWAWFGFSVWFFRSRRAWRRLWTSCAVLAYGLPLAMLIASSEPASFLAVPFGALVGTIFVLLARLAPRGRDAASTAA